ncbi:MAG TPA: hypothetical protein VNG51_27570 [Ktedonobacteraceae bacterium]|nr:hypothetical protein [Ktedonobacteraceae bacterium]
MREQIAHHSPVPARTNAASQGNRQKQYPPASTHRAGHSSGIHPEDTPYLTGQQTNRYTSYNAPTSTDIEDDDEGIYPIRPKSSAIIRRQPVFTEPVHKVAVKQQRRGKHPLFYIGLVLVAVVVGAIASSVIPQALGRWNDDRVYGFPRTYQTDANVGHGDPKNPISHFIALNNNGTIEVIEIPGGDPAKYPTRLYVIGRLTGSDASLAPVTISFRDENGDGKLDMDIVVNDSLWVLFNNGTSFVNKL